MGPKVIVIGAGWAGLSAARSYTQVNADVDLTILDDDTSVGGVWSKRRIYPGLLADSPRGLYEYSDLSMLEDSVFQRMETSIGSADGVKVQATGEKESKSLHEKEKYGLITGEEVHNYFECYAEKYDLLRRIRFQSRVAKAERIAPDINGLTGWMLTLTNGETLTCEKLIVATGLYSQPHIPSIPGFDTFQGVSIHSKLLGTRHRDLASDVVSSVTVIGGCKSALEAINLCLALPQKPHIHWILRDKVHGVPVINNDPNSRPSLLAVGSTRLMAAFSPSIFDTDSSFYRFFQSGKSWMGNRLYAGFWNLFSWAILRNAGYDNSEQGKAIKPKTKNLFRSTLYASLIHKGNPVLDELHKGERITVHLGELGRTTSDSIIVRKKTQPKATVEVETEKKEEEVETNAIIWCTGWTYSTSFFAPEETARLGLPVPITSQSPSEQRHWEVLYASADVEVIKAFPALRSWPLETRKEDVTNYRMYRQILSPHLLAQNDRSIAFVGFISNGQTALCSQLMGLWTVAWLEGLLPKDSLPNEEEMERNVAKVHAWMGRRYGGRGLTGPQVVMEVQSYLDVLMRDLGLDPHRKKGWKESLGVYGAQDYRGVVEEFLAKRGRSNTT